MPKERASLVGITDCVGRLCPCFHFVFPWCFGLFFGVFLLDVFSSVLLCFSFHLRVLINVTSSIKPVRRSPFRYRRRPPTRFHNGYGTGNKQTTQTKRVVQPGGAATAYLKSLSWSVSAVHRGEHPVLMLLLWIAVLIHCKPHCSL